MLTVIPHPGNSSLLVPRTPSWYGFFRIPPGISCTIFPLSPDFDVLLPALPCGAPSTGYRQIHSAHWCSFSLTRRIRDAFLYIFPNNHYVTSRTINKYLYLLQQESLDVSYAFSSILFSDTSSTFYPLLSPSTLTPKNPTLFSRCPNRTPHHFPLCANFINSTSSVSLFGNLLYFSCFCHFP